MKIKTLFIAFLSLLALAACNKKEFNPEISNPDTESRPELSTKSVELKLKIQSLSTRAVEVPVADATKSEVQKLHIYAVNPSGLIDKAIALTQEEYNALEDDAVSAGKILKLEGISGHANKIIVVANSNLPAASAATHYSSITVLDNLIDEQRGDGVKKLPMYGESAVGNLATGATVVNVNVAIAPVLARVEISGSPILSAGLSNFVIEAVYVDNYDLSIAPVPPAADIVTVLAESGFTDFTTVSHPLQETTAIDWVNNEGKFKAKELAVAFHLFTNKQPNILIKATADFKDPKSGAESKQDGYFSFTKFFTEKDKALTHIGDELEAATIYSIDLEKCDWNRSGEWEDPNDPNAPGYPGPYPPIDPGVDVLTPDNFKPVYPKNKELRAIVTLKAWTVKNIVPGGL